MSFASSGEDLVAANLLLASVGGLETESLANLPKVLADEGLGGYIDVGAGHPTIRNNTYLFYRLGLRGVAVEPIPALADKWSRDRPEDLLVGAAALSGAREGSQVDLWLFEPYEFSTCDRRRADELVARASDGSIRFLGKSSVDCITLRQVQEALDQRPALVSIDVEAGESAVIEGLDLEVHRPHLIIIEVAGLIAQGGLIHTTCYRTLSEKEYCLKAIVGSNFFFLDVEGATSFFRRLPLGLL